MEKTIAWVSQSPEETQAFGAAVGTRLRGGEVICLIGPLGAGKTCLTQGIARALEIEEVSSPSYILISEFRGRLPLFHIDAYRLKDNDPDLQDTGIDDCLTESGVCVIEWADRLRAWLPQEFLEIQMDHVPRGRSLRVTPCGSRYESLVRELGSNAHTWD